MKSMFMIMLLALISCTSGKWSGSKNNELFQMNQIWKVKPHQQEVINSFGPHFEKIQEGISYNYEKTSFTKMAFFFGKDKKLIDQFAIVDEVALSVFKKDFSCKWNEKKIEIKEAHIIRTTESGKCSKHKVEYHYRRDLGFYEIRWF